MMVLPRVSSPYPKFAEALYGGVRQQDVPVEMEMVIDEANNEHFSLYVAQIAALSSGFDRKLAAALEEATMTYLLETGNPSALVEIVRSVLKMHVLRTEIKVSVGNKRAATDKKKSFEKRLDSYCSTELFRTEIINEIKASLAQLGHPANPEEAGRLLESGRRERTNAVQLQEAIKMLGPGLHATECNSRFENLATQVWDWKYPKLSHAKRTAILDDFSSKQAEISQQKRPTTASSNTTIRMLWHFNRAGIECDFDMFKIPRGVDAWKRNMAALSKLT